MNSIPKFNLGDKVTFQGSASKITGEIIEIYIPTHYNGFDEVKYDILVKPSPYHTPVTYRQMKESLLEGTNRYIRNPDRIDPFLEKVGKLWKQYPDLRFQQFIDLIVSKSKDSSDPFFWEETKWSKLIDDIFNNK